MSGRLRSTPPLDTMSNAIHTNAPAAFQALVNDVLRDFPNHFIFVYLDDILIFSSQLTTYRLLCSIFLLIPPSNLDSKTL